MSTATHRHDDAVTIDGREYASALAPHISSLVAAKRAAGYSYAGPAYHLWRLDRFCVDGGRDEACVTRELSDAWAEAVPGEGGSSKSGRVTALRQLAIHEVILGLPAYVPRVRVSVGQPTVYLPTTAETRELLRLAEQIPEDPRFPHMAAGYGLAFRLMRLCGMRISECASMALADVDAAAGTLLVRHSKGDKDRLVYMAPVVAAMVAAHAAGLRSRLGRGVAWLLPGRDPTSHIWKGTLDNVFSRLWDLVPGAAGRPKRPTCHALRHAYVCDRVNLWARQGVPLGQMMPYLARQLGHTSETETLYYYHYAEEAMALTRNDGGISGRVIPEVI